LKKKVILTNSAKLQGLTARAAVPYDEKSVASQ